MKKVVISKELPVDQILVKDLSIHQLIISIREDAGVIEKLQELYHSDYVWCDLRNSYNLATPAWSGDYYKSLQDAIEDEFKHGGQVYVFDTVEEFAQWVLDRKGIKQGFKVGDKVRIKSDLIVEGRYDGRCRFDPAMSFYKGKIATITKERSTPERFSLDVDDGDWSWSPSMMEHVN